MPPLISNSIPQDALWSAMQAQQTKASMHQQNLASENDPSYIRLDCQIKSDRIGVTTSELQQCIDENLIKEIRSQNSRVCGLDSINKYYNDVIEFFGGRDEQSSFAHVGQEMTLALKAFALTSTNPSSMQDALVGIQKHAKSITQLATRIQTLQGTIEGDITQSVSIANGAIRRITELNKEIKEATNASRDTFQYENERRQEMQLLSEQLGLHVIPFDGKQNVIYDANGNVLVMGEQGSNIDYTKINGTRTLSVNTIDFRSVDISTSIHAHEKTGRLAGLMRLTDDILPGLQAQLDEYTRVMRDTYNQIHNLGISMNPPSTLTGSIGVPGVPNLTGGTVISGTGTVRIGLFDPNTKYLTSYTDIPFTDNMTVGALIASINSANPTSGVTASITADGRFQLDSNTATQGVVIGSVGETIASLSSTSAYDGSVGTNLSHFFGLNNLFETGTQILGGPIKGISSSLSVRSDISASSGARISQGTLLNHDIIGPDQIVLEPGNIEILSSLANAYDNPHTQFNRTSVSAPMRISLSSYSNLMIKQRKENIERNAEELKNETFIYERLSRSAKAISGVNKEQTLKDILDVNTSISFLVRAMSLANKMDQELLKIM
ncbi:MAG: flagellin hook IN motif-containing protein [Pseudomonadota bacterium]